jgi:hypothetical protein
VTGAAPGDLPERVLVPGELRGFRQFQLLPDGLYPLVHFRTGAWDGRVEEAVCDVGGDHPAPARECRCGLYAWYTPGSATVALGHASAVVVARGRTILGDRGFRAAQARIEAVALPAAVRWLPAAASRARRMLAERYPEARVYSSTRRMLRDYPPDDVSALGIDPPRDRSRGYRAAAAWLWVAFVVLSYSVATIPSSVLSRVATQWWPLLVVVAVAWQAGLVWIFMRLVALQAPHRTGRPRHRHG